MGSSHSLAHRGAILPFCWFFFLRGWITFFKFNIALRTLDLSGWSNVTQVGDNFLSDCTSLTTLDISGWNNVTRSFLYNCSALRTLNLSGLTNATDIEKGFLEGCTIFTSSINVTGSSSVVSEYVQSRSGSLMDDTNDISHAAEVVKEDTKCKCVCM